MNFRHVRMLLLLFTMILWNVLLNAWILERTRQINCFSYETALYSFREHRVSGELLARMQEEAEEKGMSEKELFAVYFAEDGSVTDPGQLAVEALYAKRYQPQAYARICGYLSAVWDDLERFPVGTVASDGNAGVSFADSWMQSRNFGGERGHEGCDIMASVNERGIYPIYSVSDGVVENVGWLRLGGTASASAVRPEPIFIMRIWRSMRRSLKLGRQSLQAPIWAIWGIPVTAIFREPPATFRCICTLESISTMRTGRNFP